MSKSETALALLVLTGGCRAPRPVEPAGPPPAGELIVAGRRFPVAAPVVHWFDEPYYSAYSTEPRFDTGASGATGPEGLRYRPGRDMGDPQLAARMAQYGPTLEGTRRIVRGLVVHYDVSGTSRQCFRVLQDQRGLSVHFLCDVDGTLYQTLDLADQAWHAAAANPWTVGVEVAHIGAYPPGETAALERWYTEDEEGPLIRIPAELGDGGVRTPGFVGRPARPDRVTGEVHGATYVQPDFTDEQYDSLAALAAALHEALPRIVLEAPRDAAGVVRTDALSEAELAAYQGLLGHSHVTARKRDPGPAFDWERVLAEARALAASDP